MTQNDRVSAFAYLSALIVGIALIVAVASGFGRKLGFWEIGFGFQLLRWGVYIGIVGSVLSLISMIVLIRSSANNRGIGLSFVALVTGVCIVGVPLTYYKTARNVPAIHDITTDTQNPPEFDAVIPFRRHAPNPSDYGGPDVAKQQKEAYPDITTLHTQTTPDSVFEDALRTAYQMGWKIVNAEKTTGKIEATDETFWFGFKDDVVIRVLPDSIGSRVDVRSVSRVGKSDIGTNARRIRDYLDKLKSNLPE